MGSHSKAGAMDIRVGTVTFLPGPSRTAPVLHLAPSKEMRGWEQSPPLLESFREVGLGWAKAAPDLLSGLPRGRCCSSESLLSC